MKTILSILFVALGLPALAGNSEEALRKQLATIEKQINELRISQKALYGKRSAVLKQLHAAKIAASRKPTPAKGKPNKPSTRKPSPKKKPAATKPGVKKPSTKKPSSDVAKKAAESRARFLQRFDTNRDGKVAKEEAKAVLAAEAKKRAASRKKPAKPSVKKTSTKKPSSDVAKRATESRAKFLQRFDANRDGKVTKEETKAVLAAEAKKREASRKKPAKPSVKKTSTKKPLSDVAKKATESRAKFLQRFDANRDGKVTKEETKAVLAAEAKKRAAAREKKKR